jgi:alkanesulfonate monooxygenase
MAETKSNVADSTNGHANGATDGYTPIKQLDLNQDPDRVLFA